MPDNATAVKILCSVVNEKLETISKNFETMANSCKKIRNIVVVERHGKLIMSVTPRLFKTHPPPFVTLRHVFLTPPPPSTPQSEVESYRAYSL